MESEQDRKSDTFGLFESQSPDKFTNSNSKNERDKNLKSWLLTIKNVYSDKCTTDKPELFKFSLSSNL